MTRYKISERGVVFDGLILYCSHFKQYSRFMLFPVFGQLFGIIWALATAYLFSKNLDTLVKDIPLFYSYTSILVCILLIAAPGLILFMKSFWDFLVAYGALNSMTEGAMATGKIYDFPAHRAVVTRRSASFIALWILFSLFSFFSFFPLLWVIGAIFFVYFVLIFQVFTFEEDVSLAGCFKRSLMLIKGNFFKTFLIMAVLGFVTYYFLELGISVIFDAIKLTPVLLGLLEGFSSMLPIEGVNELLSILGQPLITPLAISKSIIDAGISMTVIMFTLPLRSVVWTLWYKKLSDRDGIPSKITKSGKKKLDPEVLRRAKRKDD